jgi:hypothetical protein
MNGFKLGKDALIFSVLTLITVLTWIGFEVYRTATKTTIPEVTQRQMAPLEPKIKKETINQLRENLWFAEEELSFAGAQVSTKSAEIE